MIKVRRNMAISIEPSVGEVADMIWSMDSDQQAFLLEQLALKFKEVRMNGYTQMLNIAEDVKKRDTIGTVGGLIDDLHEYIGYETLTQQMAESEETDERG